MQDVEDKVQKTFPTPIDKVSDDWLNISIRCGENSHRKTSQSFSFFPPPQWALADAHDTIDKTKKKKSVLPVERMHTILQKVRNSREIFVEFRKLLTR